MSDSSNHPQRKTKNPCVRCGMGAVHCICKVIPTLNLKTRVMLVIHTLEMPRTTNTGKLALEALPNSALRVRGEGRIPLDLTQDLDPAYQSLLFYPAPGAAELTTELARSFDKPIQLIVPDGSWRQARKVHTRHPELTSIPRVMISVENTAKYHLRKEGTSYGMSTLEAIARALGQIEGPAVQETMMALYQAKLRATFKARGRAMDDEEEPS